MNYLKRLQTLFQRLSKRQLGDPESLIEKIKFWYGEIQAIVPCKLWNGESWEDNELESKYWGIMDALPGNGIHYFTASGNVYGLIITEVLRKYEEDKTKPTHIGHTMIVTATSYIGHPPYYKVYGFEKRFPSQYLPLLEKLDQETEEFNLIRELLKQPDWTKSTLETRVKTLTLKEACQMTKLIKTCDSI